MDTGLYRWILIFTGGHWSLQVDNLLQGTVLYRWTPFLTGEHWPFWVDTNCYKGTHITIGHNFITGRQTGLYRWTLLTFLQANTTHYRDTGLYKMENLIWVDSPSLQVDIFH